MIPILYSDDDVLAADKPEGLPAIPGAKPGEPCLQMVLQEQVGQKLFVVHRLDKEASGVILFARNAAAHRLLNEQFSDRTVKKSYVLLVHGLLEADAGEIDRPLRLFGSGRMGVDEQAGQSARSAWSLRWRYGAYSLVEAQPETGRRHQLRVHFYSIGHAVVGDRRYGDRRQQEIWPRLMLHAESIQFRRAAGVDVCVSCPLPESFSRVLAGLA